MKDLIVLLLKATPSYWRWLGSSLLVYVSIIAAVLLSPIACLFAYKRDDGEYDLPKLFRWMTTHDAEMGVHWYNGHPKKRRWFHRYPLHYYEKYWLLRYVVFVDWILTNPAYRVKHSLGFDQKGMKVLYKRDEGKYWDSGHGNFSFWIAKNAKGKYAFMVQWQWYYYKTWCVEFYLGWKLFRMDPDRVCMIATRLSPTRKYDVKSEEDIEKNWQYIQETQKHAEAFWETGEKP